MKESKQERREGDERKGKGRSSKENRRHRRRV